MTNQQVQRFDGCNCGSDRKAGLLFRSSPRDIPSGIRGFGEGIIGRFWDPDSVISLLEAGISLTPTLGWPGQKLYGRHRVLLFY